MVVGRLNSENESDVGVVRALVFVNRPKESLICAKCASVSVSPEPIMY